MVKALEPVPRDLLLGACTFGGSLCIWNSKPTGYQHQLADLDVHPIKYLVNGVLTGVPRIRFTLTTFLARIPEAPYMSRLSCWRTLRILPLQP